MANQWIRDLVERILRNLIQALIPLLTVLAVSGAKTGWRDLALSALYVFAWTIVKALALAPFEDNITGWLASALRIASAVAASLIANVPEQFWGYNHWDRVAYAAVGAALTSLLMLYGTPPTQGATSDNSSIHGV